MRVIRGSGRQLFLDAGVAPKQGPRGPAGGSARRGKPAAAPARPGFGGWTRRFLLIALPLLGSGTITSAATATEVHDNAAPVFTSAATFSVAENTTTVGTVAATDADEADSITGYVVIGGADEALFLITDAGALTFTVAPDYEDPWDEASRTPANAAGNNEYIVEGNGDRRDGHARADGRADDHGDGDGCGRGAACAVDADDFERGGVRLHGELDGADQHRSRDPRLHGALPGDAERDLAAADRGCRHEPCADRPERRDEVPGRRAGEECRSRGAWSPQAMATTLAPNTVPAFTSAATFSVGGEHDHGGHGWRPRMRTEPTASPVMRLPAARTGPGSASTRAAAP